MAPINPITVNVSAEATFYSGSVALFSNAAPSEIIHLADPTEDVSLEDHEFIWESSEGYLLSKLLHSEADADANADFDTLVIWSPSTPDSYGAILTKNPSLSVDSFNHIVAETYGIHGSESNLVLIHNSC